MSVKAETRATSSKTDPNVQSHYQTPTHERNLMEKVLEVWKDFDVTPGPAPWRKKSPKPMELDPFGCTCGPCRRFWKENFTNVSILNEPVLKRAQKTSTMFRSDQDDWRIKVGDRVIVDGRQQGVVKFVGLLDENVIAPTVHVGVKCDEQVGSTHNGTIHGKRYFHCPRGHGALVPYTEVRRVNPPEKKPSISGNFMFDSYNEVVKQRALRRQKMEEVFESQAARTKTPSRIRKTYTAFDANDVAYKDSQREGETQVYRYGNTTVKVRTGGPPKQKIDPQAKRFAKWKEDFGGGERGERLVRTLKKLHDGLSKGKELENAVVEEEKPTDNELSALETSNILGSKPPTRSGDRTTSPTKSTTIPKTPGH